ncbi:DUF3576 domain-containing protein [Candidatus Pelagibacter sp.]|nr:DUF3576 domain-containing protein [Candidatus Pelagibacter sp.]|tara:strand:- start:214 stop:774 length:561 start_codon:yes stop_codon:yes gene_type:complete
MKLKTLKIQPLVFLLSLIIFLSSCGIYKPVDARKVPTNDKDKREKNMREGKKIKFGRGSNKKGGDFEFSSSNPLWRATLEIINFMPLSNADYSGGLIITDWYNQDNSKNESIKITVRFLSNEIRSDGLKIIIHKKVCDEKLNCKISLLKDGLGNDIKIAILKKAAKIKSNTLEKIKEDNSDIVLTR